MSKRLNRFEVSGEGVYVAWWVAAVVSLAFSIMMSGVALGQSTFGSVRGVAQDGTGAILPDTQVTLHSLDENTDHSVKTDADGNFTLENVKAGRYTVRAQHDGFADAVINGVTVD